MNLRTNYLGMKLRTPLVPSASPLSENLDNIKRMEDAGAAAVVLHSLFQEHIFHESTELHHHLTHGIDSYAEALTYFPEPNDLTIGPERYINEIAVAKEAVAIPVIASLNGSSLGGWMDYAKQIEQAGADALELNIYWIPTDRQIGGAEVEKRYLEILAHVKAAVSLPVAVKLSPFFSSFANLASELVEAGANGLVLFNRFYQPDLNPEALVRCFTQRPPEYAYGDAVTFAVDRYSERLDRGGFGGYQRHSSRGRCHQNADGRRGCDNALLDLTASRHRPDSGDRTRDGRMDGSP